MRRAEIKKTGSVSVLALCVIVVMGLVAGLILTMGTRRTRLVMAEEQFLKEKYTGLAVAEEMEARQWVQQNALSLRAGEWRYMDFDAENDGGSRLPVKVKVMRSRDNRIYVDYQLRPHGRRFFIVYRLDSKLAVLNQSAMDDFYERIKSEPGYIAGERLYLFQDGEKMYAAEAEQYQHFRDLETGAGDPETVRRQKEILLQKSYPLTEPVFIRASFLGIEKNMRIKGWFSVENWQAQENVALEGLVCMSQNGSEGRWPAVKGKVLLWPDQSVSGFVYTPTALSDKLKLYDLAEEKNAVREYVRHETPAQ